MHQLLFLKNLWPQVEKTWMQIKCQRYCDLGLCLPQLMMDDAIRKMLKRTVNMATQTNGWFLPLGRGTQTPPNCSFFTPSWWSGFFKTRAQKVCLQKDTTDDDKKQIWFNFIIYQTEFPALAKFNTGVKTNELS